MKKVLGVVLITCMLISGCSQTKIQPQPKATILKQDDIIITKQIVTSNNGYEPAGNKYNGWFKLTSEEFIQEVNKRAAEKGYKELTLLDGSDETLAMYSYNGESWYISLYLRDDDEGKGYIDSITLDLYTKSEEDSKMNGDYLYILMDMLNPGMQEQISDELYIFTEAPADIPNARVLICGNTFYAYTYDEEYSSQLEIKAVSPGVAEESNIPTAIKPE